LAQAADALAVADATVAAVALPMQIGDQEVRLKASIGISMYPDDGSDGGALMDRATAAMYHARRDGLGTHFFRNEAGTDARSLELRTAEALQPPGQAADASAEDTAALQMTANEELLQAALRAHELLAAAELAYRKQTEFMGVVAHELRGPLAPISNAAALLGLPNATGSVPLAKDIIERQVRHLSRLVADLIDVARVNTGKLRLDIQRLDLREVLRDCADAARPAMDERRQQLSVGLPAAEALINGDRVRLTQVFRNLLDNASKYTPKGGNITLAATCDIARVSVLVTDNGIGISPESLPHVFDRFTQERRATAFDGSGLGIGLALVRELVEAHDGTVVAQSAGPGCGSRFTVSLPLLPGRA
jgi:signal transduction histidine kinase